MSKRDIASYRVDQGTFSSLVLTFDELGKLKPEDRAIYLIGLMSVLQILEASQGSLVTKGMADSKSAHKVSPKIEMLFQMMESEASANILSGLQLVISAGKNFLPAAGRMLTAATGYITRSAPVGAQSTSQGAAQATKSAASSVAVTATKATSQLKDAVKANLDTYKKAKAAWAAERGRVTPDKNKLKKLEDNYKAAQKNFLKGNQSYYDDAADAATRQTRKAEVAELMKKEGIKVGPWTAALGASAAALGGQAAWDQWSQRELTPEQAAETPSPAGQAASAPAVGGAVAPDATGNSGELAGTDGGGGPAVMKVKPVAEGGCIFGLYASKWKQQGSQLNCTRPAESSTAQCRGANFQCHSAGIESLKGHGKLCISTNPLENLSQRCAKEIANLIKGENIVTREEYTKLTSGVLQFLSNIDNNLGMDSTEGAKKSIRQYCSEDDGTQQTECAAFNVVFEQLHQTEMAYVVASRSTRAAPAAADAPARPGNN